MVHWDHEHGVFSGWRHDAAWHPKQFPQTAVGWWDQIRSVFSQRFCVTVSQFSPLTLTQCNDAGFESEEEDRTLRLFAVDSYVSLLQGEPGKLPQRFLQVISWVSLHNEHHEQFVSFLGKTNENKTQKKEKECKVWDLYSSVRIQPKFGPGTHILRLQNVCLFFQRPWKQIKTD